MHDLSTEYLFAVNYLSRRELGLAPGRDELTARQEEVIVFVAGERQRQQREKTPETAADAEFQDEAEPDEMDVSDAELMAIHRKHRR